MNQKLKRNPNIIFRLLNNKLILFNERKQDLFCFDETGNKIWQLIDKGLYYAELLEIVKLSNLDVTEYEVEDFIEFLKTNDLLINANEVDFNYKSENAESIELWRFVHKHTEHYYPVTVTWEITYKCNQTCIHCYEDCDYTKNMQDLDIESIRNILIELHENGCFILNITGGEPFIRNDIYEIISIAKGLNFSINLYSNASLIDDTDIVKIKNLGISKMCITLFSIEAEKHDKIANNKGLHSKTIENIIKLRKSGVPVRINSPITKYNFEGYSDLIQFATQMNCELVISNTLTPKDDGDMSPLALCLNDNQFETILMDSSVNHVEDDNKEIFSNKLDNISCDIVNSGIAISANGNVYPCNTFKLKCGNLLDLSLSEIWENSSVLNILRNTKISQINNCRSCLKLEFCRPCPAYSWLENKEITGKSSISCRIASIKQKCYSIHPNV